MNKLKLVNLLGHTTNILAAVDIFKREKQMETVFNHYVEGFLHVSEEDINEAFEGLISEARYAIWEKVKAEQAKLREASPEEYCHFLRGEIYDLRNMFSAMIKVL